MPPLAPGELEEALAPTGKDTTKLTDDEKAALRGDDVSTVKGKAITGDDEGNADADKRKVLGLPEEEAEGVQRRRENLVPQSRVNEMVGRARARAEQLEGRVAELENQLQQGADLDFEEVEKELDKLEQQYVKLAHEEGKETEATQLRRQIRTMERRVNNMQASYFANAQSTEAVARLRTDDVIEQLEDTYAFLDPRDKENYDPDIVSEILKYQKGFVASGTAPHQAMIDAANYVLGQLDIEPVDGGGGSGEEEGLRGGQQPSDAKRELAARQPVNLGKAGKTGVPKTVSADELAKAGQQRFSKVRSKLTDDEIATARGDFIQ